MADGILSVRCCGFVIDGALVVEMKNKIPIEDYLPDGPIRDLGHSYLETLPDVEEKPLGWKDFFDDKSSSVTDYAVSYLLLYPYVVFLAAMVFSAFLFAWKQIGGYRERKKKEPCSHCGHLLYLCALRCPNCMSVHENPKKVDWMGFSSRWRRALPRHDCSLRRFRRCHVCGEYLSSPRENQDCPACGTEVFENEEQLLRYDRYIQKRRWFVYGVVLLISWVPIVGSLVSSSFYRKTLVAPYASYMALAKESLLVVVLRVFRFLFRYLPLIGSIGMPILAVVENNVFRRFFMGRKEEEYRDKQKNVEQ